MATEKIMTRSASYLFVLMSSGLVVGCGAPADGAGGTDGDATGAGDESGVGDTADDGGGDGDTGGPDVRETIRVIASGPASLSFARGNNTAFVDIVDGEVQPAVPLHPESTDAAAYLAETAAATERWLPIFLRSNAPSLEAFLMVDLWAPSPNVDDAVVVEGFDETSPTRVHSLSPNEDMFAVFASGVASARSVFVIPIDEHGPHDAIRVHEKPTPGNGVDAFSWSPNGAHFAWAGRIDGQWRVVVAGADPFVPGESRQLVATPNEQSPVATLRWVGDGNWLMWSLDDDDDGVLEYFVADVRDGNHTPARFDPGVLDVYWDGLSFDADMTTALFYVRSSPRYDLYIMPFSGTAFESPVRVETSVEGGDVNVRSGHFAMNGRWLSYLTRDTFGVWRTMVVEITGGVPSNPVPVMDPSSDLESHLVGVSSDGRTLYLEVGPEHREFELFRVQLGETGPQEAVAVEASYVPVRVASRPYHDNAWLVSEYGSYVPVGWHTIDFDDPQAGLEPVAMAPEGAIMGFYDGGGPERVPNTDDWVVHATEPPTTPGDSPRTMLRYVPENGDLWGTPIVFGEIEDFFVRRLEP